MLVTLFAIKYKIETDAYRQKPPKIWLYGITDSLLQPKSNTWIYRTQADFYTAILHATLFGVIDLDRLIFADDLNQTGVALLY